MQRRTREGVRHLLGVLEAAVGIHALADPRDVRRATLPPRLARGTRQGGRVRLASACLQQMNQHQRPLALPQIAVELLAVAHRVAGEIQQVVLDLKRGAEEEAEANEAIEVAFAAACR